MGVSKEPTPMTHILNLSPLGEACSRMDLTAIHEILEDIGYSGDEGVTDEVFSQTHKMVDEIVFIFTQHDPEYFSKTCRDFLYVYVFIL